MGLEDSAHPTETKTMNREAILARLKAKVT
jgi:hypothetical protein